MENQKCFFRMPLGYGPFPGPRQSATGAYPVPGWDKATSTTCAVVFKAPKEQLASFLPSPCFYIEAPGEFAYASISFTRLEQLPWLAGRGYNHCGLYIHNVVCRGKEETVYGKYLSVLFENRADPITSGREELGYAKVYSSLDEVTNEGGNWTLQIGWEGTVFGEIKLKDLVSKTNKNDEFDSFFEAKDILHYKYIPKTGSPGVADVEYPTVSPIPSPPTTAPKVLHTQNAKLEFKAFGFNELPTLSHIATKWAEIEIAEIVGAKMSTVLGASDFRNQRSIQV